MDHFPNSQESDCNVCCTLLWYNKRCHLSFTYWVNDVSGAGRQHFEL